MPTLNIGIDSTQATTGGRNIRAELQKINKEAKHTIILLSQMGKIQSWRQVKTQLDSMGKSAVRNFNDLDVGLKGANKELKNFRTAAKKACDHMNDTVNTFGKANKQMNRFGRETKKSTSLINTWIGKYSIIMSGMAASIFVFQNVFLALRKLVQVFKEFNAALGKLKLKLVAEDLKWVETYMLQFQATSRYSVTDFANAMDMMLDYGANFVDAMKNMRKLEQFAIITQKKFGTSTREMIDILKRYGLSVNEMNTAFAIYAAQHNLISTDMEYMANLVSHKLTEAFGQLAGSIKTVVVQNTSMAVLAEIIQRLANLINSDGPGIVKFFNNLAKGLWLSMGYFFGSFPSAMKMLKELQEAAKTNLSGEIPGEIKKTPSAWIRSDMTQKDRPELMSRMYGARIDFILKFEQEKMKIQADAIEDEIKRDEKALKEKERNLKELERLLSQYNKALIRTETSDIKERSREEKAAERDMKQYIDKQVRHEERMIADRLRAYKSLYRELKQMRGRNFDFERQMLKREYDQYVKIFGREIPELLEWFAYKQRELLKEELMEEGGFFGGIQSGLMDLEDDIKHFYQEWGKYGKETVTNLVTTFEDSFVSVFKGKLDNLKDIWKNFTQSLLDSFIKIMAKMATQALAAPIIVPFFGGMMGQGGTAMANKALGLPANAAVSGLGSSIFGKLGGVAGSAKSMLGGFMGTSWLDARLGVAGMVNKLGFTNTANSIVGMNSNLFGAGMAGIGGLLTGITTGDWGKAGGQTIGSILGGLTPLGPLGAIAGGIIGNLLVPGKKPHRMRGKGSAKATGDLMDFIDIDAWGWGKHGPKKSKIEGAIQSSLEAVRDQYESIFTALPLEYKTSFVETFEYQSNKFYVKGSKKHFEDRLKKAITNLSKDFDKTIQKYLTNQVKSYGKAQLESISKSAGFAILSEDSPVMTFYNELVTLMNSSGRWDAAEMEKYMSAISELEGYIEDIASAVENAFKDVKDIIARFELTDIQYELYKLQQWYDEQIETWKSLKGILTTEQLNQHLADINKAFGYLRQEVFDNFIDPLTQFFEDMSISDLAPVQSMEQYQRLLQEKMLLAESGNAADLQALMDFAKGSYLPFMKAFGEGDYNTIYTQLMDTLRGLTEALKLSFGDQTLREIQPIGSYQHGTDYVPQTGSYVLHRGEKVVTAEQNQPQEIHIHLDVDGRQIGYVIAKDIRSNSELINAVRRAIQ